ncbi:PH domain-containing protein [Streptomyces sp. NRRL WC-3618]|uniref:PH domain-containing protein n=1 Tax=Streptomyces sp. NRRL WC-3618 TaxID=1519490 RepID=UPI0006AF9769|nr:PH domain-containing protein [Streptomyces sp. NRRL WC-3618]
MSTRTPVLDAPGMPDEPRLPAGQPWQRLHPRMIVVSVSWLVGPAVPLLGAILVARDLLNSHGLIVLGSYIVVAGVQAGHEWVRYRTTRFRITDSKVELHSGLFFRTDKSIPRDRVRSADLTANPVHRLFGLAAVKVGTGQHTARSEDDELVLDGISRDQALQFRALLLNRSGTTNPDGTAASPELPVPLARMRWSWAWYAPLTVTTVAGVLAVVTGGSKLLDTLGLDITDSGIARNVWDWLSSVPLALAIAAVTVVLLAVGVAGSLVAFAEAWYGYRLEREPEGSLHLVRGLLTSRSVSVAERRICGVELTRPLPLRLLSAARLNLLATGLGGHSARFSNPAQLMPAAPLDSAHQITADVLDLTSSPITQAALRGHPRPALRRRLVRGCLLAPAGAAALAGAGAGSGLLPWWTVAAAALLTAACGAPLAWDAYRGLGHALHGDYLVVRQGAFVRRTVALRRERIVGWTGRQSYTQRRAGLCTLTATTAAGKGAVRIRDIGVAEGLGFAEATLPGLLAPFCGTPTEQHH